MKSSATDVCLIQAARAYSRGTIDGGAFKTFVYLLDQGPAITRNHREMAAEREVSPTCFSSHLSRLKSVGLLRVQHRSRALSIVTIVGAGE